MDTKYTATATARGDGRNGEVVSDDGVVDEKLALPKELGGAGGEATNPEQLFAAGYAGCFHQAVKMAAGEKKADAEGSTVEAKVGIGPDGDSFGLQVWLTTTIPGTDQATADAIVERAHELCPYSKATRGNVEVSVTAKVA